MIDSCPICKSPDIQVRNKEIIFCVLCGNEWHLKSKSFPNIDKNKIGGTPDEYKAVKNHNKNEVMITA